MTRLLDRALDLLAEVIHRFAFHDPDKDRHA
jgi:hypothetical protein